MMKDNGGRYKIVQVSTTIPDDTRKYELVLYQTIQDTLLYTVVKNATVA
jgi:hypothetical protein